MPSRDRSGRNRPAAGPASPARYVVPGGGTLAGLLAERLGQADGGSEATAGAVWVHVAYEPAAALGAPEPASLRSTWGAAKTADASAVVVVTSAMVLGPVVDGVLPLSESAATPDHGGDRVVDHLRAVEREVAVLRREGPVPLHVLRPAVLVGPGLDSPFLRHFAAPRLVVARGVHDAWQFCHVDDLATAIPVAVQAGIDAAAVGAPGFLEALDVTRIARRRRFELSESTLLAAADRLHRIGVTPGTAESMRYLLHPWPVEVARLPAAGWHAAHDNAALLAELVAMADHHVGVAGRLVSRKEAVGGAAGAAGVTAAAVGAAVLARRVRRRRG